MVGSALLSRRSFSKKLVGNHFKRIPGSSLGLHLPALLYKRWIEAFDKPPDNEI